MISSLLTLGNVVNSALLAVALLSTFIHVKEKDAGALYIFQYVGFNAFPYLRFII
jgi:hypothetical protein